MMEIKITVDDIDYSSIVELAVPVIAEKIKNNPDAGLAASIFSKTQGISGAVAKAAFAVMPKKTKDDIAAELINKYRDKIAKMIEDELSKREIKLSVKSIEANCNETE